MMPCSYFTFPSMFGSVCSYYCIFVVVSLLSSIFCLLPFGEIKLNLYFTRLMRLIRMSSLGRKAQAAATVRASYELAN